MLGPKEKCDHCRKKVLCVVDPLDRSKAICETCLDIRDNRFATCPKCRKQSSTRGDQPTAFYCHHCKMYFDQRGDDGDIGYGRPEKRIERQERARAAVTNQRRR